MQSKIEQKIAAFRQQNAEYGYCVLRADGAVWLKVYLHGRCEDSQAIAPQEIAAAPIPYPPPAGHWPCSRKGA